MDNFRSEQSAGTAVRCFLCGGAQFPAPHHIISRQRCRNNPEAWKLVDDTYRALLVVTLCQPCHANAHNREMIRALLKKQIELGFTPDYVEGVLDEIANTSIKGTLDDLRWERLMD